MLKDRRKRRERPLTKIIMSKDGGSGGMPFNKKLLLQGGGELILNDEGEGKAL